MDFDPDALRNRLRELLGAMPITQLVHGEANVSQNGLADALRRMPVGPQGDEAQLASMWWSPGALAGAFRTSGIQRAIRPRIVSDGENYQ